MDLSGIVRLIEDLPAVQEAERRAAKAAPSVAILDAAKPCFIAALHGRWRGPLLVLTAAPERAKQIADELGAWLGSDARVFLLPEPDALPYERIASDPSTVQQRLGALLALYSARRAPSVEPAWAPIVVASAHAATVKTVRAGELDASTHTLRRGMSASPAELAAQWVDLGYEPVPMVEAPGQFSRRGGIADIFPPTSEYPARLEFFGDEIDSLRLFDPATQRSVRLVEAVSYSLAHETPAYGHGPTLDQLVLQSRDDDAGGTMPQHVVAEMKELIAQARNQASLLEHLPTSALVVLDEPERLAAEAGRLHEQAEELRAGQVERGQLPADYPVPYWTWPEFSAQLESLPHRIAIRYPLVEGDDQADVLAPFKVVGAYGGRLRPLIRDVLRWTSEGRTVVITSQQARRLSELLNDAGSFAEPAHGVTTPPLAGGLTLLHGSLPEGFAVVTGEKDLILLTDREIFGFIKPRRQLKRRPVARDAFLSSLELGDYVVHIEHGIGRFTGLIKMSLDGVEREYLRLDYAEGDRLYVPVDQLDRVNRYVGAGEHVPALTRLGTHEWARAKAKVQRSVRQIAQDLLALYAARELAPGFAFSPDSVWQQELEASFPYVETPDQLEAIREVKSDMQANRPMDRLICGDVGYGKTEIAVRAAFKAVLDGKQVAILVPTTVLAQQHYATFRERVGAFPVRIEVLSRFRSEKEQRAVLQGLKDGSVDICIGTHRLIQKDVVFKDLGLLIIDEEQRFGVAHKEHLKNLRKEVDVLTLTATPIPRTLHMSLVGVRDLSTMETPPEERLPIKTFVTGYDDRLVREAILRELDRGGQVFFVHNRVYNIAQVANKLMDLVPEAEVAVAHGQMDEQQLERVMMDFVDGKTDVLVCTTIIESGLDIPNANTIIVNQADRFGLAQLYQLRGRVGRGANRAYAYFLYDKDRRLTETAEKRLRTIFEATELGAGYRIAMRDLEIRGAGNLLGAEQSGHIAAVGFDLYCRLLADAVTEMKTLQGATPAVWRDTAETAHAELAIDLPLSAFLPVDYVADDASRLGLYQRLALLSRLEDLEDMAQELRDRFGEAPEPARNLLYLLEVKIRGALAGMQSIKAEGQEITLKMGNGVPLDRASLIRSFSKGVKVGNTQIKLNMAWLGSRWRDCLIDLLRFVADAKGSYRQAGSAG